MTKNYIIPLPTVMARAQAAAVVVVVVVVVVVWEGGGWWCALCNFGVPSVAVS